MLAQCWPTQVLAQGGEVLLELSWANVGPVLAQQIWKVETPPSLFGFSVAADDVSAAAAMPTTLTWEYVSIDDDDVGDSIQRAYAGDVGIDDDDDVGELTITAMDGSDLVVQYTDKNGDDVEERRPASNIRAKIVRPAPSRPLATGRPGQRKDGIFTFLGTAGESSTPPPAKPRAQGKAAKGLGRGSGGGNGSGGGKAAAKVTAAPAAAAKRGRESGATVDARATKARRQTTTPPPLSVLTPPASLCLRNGLAPPFNRLVAPRTSMRRLTPPSVLTLPSVFTPLFVLAPQSVLTPLSSPFVLTPPSMLTPQSVLTPPSVLIANLHETDTEAETAKQRSHMTCEELRARSHVQSSGARVAGSRL